MRPTTVSPTWNVPDVIENFKKFWNTILSYIFSIKECIHLSERFHSLRNKLNISRSHSCDQVSATVLSPTDSLSNCSVTTVCNPVLDSTPVRIVSLSVSSVVVTVVCPNCSCRVSKTFTEIINPSTSVSCT